MISRMKSGAVYRERLPYRASTYRRIHHHHAEHRRLRLPDLQRRTCSVGNSSYKAILKQSAKEFAKYNQLYPDQFSKLEKDMINGFGSAKEQWFSFYAAGGSELLGTACSSTRSAGRCTPPKARILSTCKHAGRRGSISTMRYTDWRAATLKTKWLSLNPEYR
ncbi:hypothetical protein BANRA_05302 [Klebsiella pneumoniae]|nr:hypothetical protein BANRA_05302 [Klebsiella pneumoniae]